MKFEHESIFLHSLRSFFVALFGVAGGFLGLGLIAVLFVVFDVETIFLFPWAVMLDKLVLFGFIEMMIFLGILIVGYIFVWNRGALDWA